MSAKKDENRDELDWPKLARIGFSKILEAEFSREMQREIHRKYTVTSLDDFDDDKDESSLHLVTSSTETLKENPEKLVLPWLPKASVIPMMMSVLAVARALGGGENLCKLCSPASLIELNMSSHGLHQDKLLPLLRSIIREWCSAVPQAEVRSEDIEVIFPPEPSDGNYRSIARSLSSFINDAEESVREGKVVFVLSSDIASICPVLADVRQHSLTCPPLDQQGLVEILCVLRNDANELGAEALMRILPKDNLLKSLSATVLEAAVRQKSLPEAIERLAAVSRRSLGKAEVTLEDVHGQNEAVAVFNRMIADLELWKNGEIRWSDASMSAVLYGPPGNGKTLLAAAVAGSAGVPLVSTSYSDCQRAGHQGDMLRELNNAFERAFKLAPCVLFIDEIDNFSDRTSGNHADYLRGVVNGLLTLLSRATAFPGVILLAATNHLSTIDPAVVRPGRFDLKIPIRNPTIKGIERILLGHLKQQPQSEDDRVRLQHAARTLLGGSGAEVAAKAREALTMSRGEGRPFKWSDLSETLRDKKLLAAEGVVRRMAVHEAGHIVVNALTSLPIINRVNISLQQSSVDLEQINFLTEETASEFLRTLVAGRAAEKLCFGDVSTASGNGIESDLARATLVALKIETEWCLNSQTLLWMKAETFMTIGMPNDLYLKAARRLAQAEREALEVLSENKDALLQIAEILFERRELLEEDISQILLTLGLGKSKSDGQEHEGLNEEVTKH